MGAAEAHEIAVDAGAKSKLKPSALPAGTRVEVRDLFYATPARLKFMKSERVESAAITEMVKRLALARPEIAFALSSDERTVFRLEACPPGLLDHGLARMGRILGPDFVKDALPLRAARGNVVLEGFAGLPTLHRPNGLQLHLVVNGRPVRDKLLAGTVRAAYGDLLPHGRYPCSRCSCRCRPTRLTSTSIPPRPSCRFRDPNGVRSLIIGALREALGAAGHRATASLAQAALGRMAPPQGQGARAAPYARALGLAEQAQAPLAVSCATERRYAREHRRR